MLSKLKIHIYECFVHLEIFPTQKSVCTRVNVLSKKYKLNLVNSDIIFGITLSSFNNYHIILSEQSLKDWNTFFHELAHCVDFICKDRDIEDLEARAYLMGYIGNYFLNKLIKYKNEKNIS